MLTLLIDLRSQVVSKGWTQGRRVSGVAEDWSMIGTRHICMLYHLDHDKLKVGESLPVSCTVSRVIAAAMIPCTTSYSRCLTVSGIL